MKGRARCSPPCLCNHVKGGADLRVRLPTQHCFFKYTASLIGVMNNFKTIFRKIHLSSVQFTYFQFLIYRSPDCQMFFGRFHGIQGSQGAPCKMRKSGFRFSSLQRAHQRKPKESHADSLYSHQKSWNSIDFCPACLLLMEKSSDPGKSWNSHKFCRILGISRSGPRKWRNSWNQA